MSPESGPSREPRVFRASNSGPFTLDGTRTFLVGRERVAVVDPGPDDEEHRAALVRALEEAREVRLLLTHGHGDHAAGAPALARITGARMLGSAPGASPLQAGEAVPTDHGDLVVIPTPGHTRDHLVFHWPRAGALFAGDLVLGEGETTWVGAYPGCVADYLDSLERLEELGVRRIYPAHGPPLEEPAEALVRFREHRKRRIREVAEIRRERPDAPPPEIARVLYGPSLPMDLVAAAERSVEAILHHLDGP